MIVLDYLKEPGGMIINPGAIDKIETIADNFFGLCTRVFIKGWVSKDVSQSKEYIEEKIAMYN